MLLKRPSGCHEHIYEVLSYPTDGLGEVNNKRFSSLLCSIQSGHADLVCILSTTCPVAIQLPPFKLF